MTLDFNFEPIQSTEFGVGRENDNGQSFALVPVDASVQSALQDMARATWTALQDIVDDPQEYQPSEKYAAHEHLYIAADNSMASSLMNLHSAKNLPHYANVLSEPEELFCYFAKFAGPKGKRLTAVRRATQFKGVLKSRLVQFMTDALRLVEDRTFRLDNDFDMLIDSSYIHILRPSGFEFLGGLQEAIRKAVPQNVAAIQKDMPFVDLASIQAYAERHTRAARHVASIRSQQETQNVSSALLKKVCKTHGIELVVTKGVISIPSGHEMDFLDVLDRRMYQLELVEGSPERYKAGSRRKINN